MGPYFVDFFCAEAALVIEVDGPSHIGKSHKDGKRDEWLQARGLRVLRVSNDDVLQRPEETLRRIAGLLDPRQ